MTIERWWHFLTYIISGILLLGGIIWILYNYNTNNNLLASMILISIGIVIPITAGVLIKEFKLPYYTNQYNKPSVETEYHWWSIFYYLAHIISITLILIGGFLAYENSTISNNKIYWSLFLAGLVSYIILITLEPFISKNRAYILFGIIPILLVFTGSIAGMTNSIPSNGWILIWIAIIFMIATLILFYLSVDNEKTIVKKEKKETITNQKIISNQEELSKSYTKLRTTIKKLSIENTTDVNLQQLNLLLQKTPTLNIIKDINTKFNSFSPDEVKRYKLEEIKKDLELINKKINLQDTKMTTSTKSTEEMLKELQKTNPELFKQIVPNLYESRSSTEQMVKELQKRDPQLLKMLGDKDLIDRRPITGVRFAEDTKPLVSIRPPSTTYGRSDEERLREILKQKAELEEKIEGEKERKACEFRYKNEREERLRLLEDIARRQSSLNLYQQNTLDLDALRAQQAFLIQEEEKLRQIKQVPVLSSAQPMDRVQRPPYKKYSLI